MSDFISKKSIFMISIDNSSVIIKLYNRTPQMDIKENTDNVKQATAAAY